MNKLTGVTEERFYPASTFRGLRRLPFLVWARNNAYHYLALGPDYVRIRVLRTRRILLEKVERIDYQRFGGHLFTFLVKGSLATYGTGFYDLELARQFARALQSRGASVGESVIRLLDEIPE